MVRSIISKPQPLQVVANATGQAKKPQRGPPPRAHKGKSLDQAKRLNDATGNEFFGAQLFTPDANADLPLALERADLRASLGPNKWTVGDTHGAFSLMGNRGGFALSQNPDVGVEQLSVSGFKNVGAAGGGASYAVHHSAAQTVRLGLDAFGTQYLAGIAPSMNWTDGKGTRAGIGVGLFGATDFSIRLIEAYDDPDALNHGKALVEVRRHANPGIAFDPSRVVREMGLGAKVVFSGSQETVYRTVMDQDQLGELLYRTQVNKQGLRGLFARIGAATGATRAPVVMADVRDPLNMLGQSKPLQTGEQVTDTLTGSNTVGAAPGAWGLRMGFFYHRNKATACTVERLDATRIKLTVSPTKVDAVSMGIDALLVADARRELSQSTASRHSAVFDLANPKAWHAYQALVANPETFDVAALAATPGVEAGAHETTESRMQRDGAGMPRPPLPGHFKIAGVGRHAVGLEQNHTLKLGKFTYGTRRLVHDTQTHRLVGGEANARIDTLLHTRATDDHQNPEFVAVSLNLVFEYDRLTGGDASYLRDAIQTLSGDAIPEQAAHLRGHDYKVAVNRVLGRDDFVQMARCSPLEVAQAAERFGAQTLTLGDIIASITEHQGDLHAMSNALGNHLARADVPTWTALCHLAPKHVPAAVEVRSDTFTETTRLVREFLLQDAATPVTKRDNARSLKAIARLQRQVERALSQVENDTLLERYEPAARQKHLGMLLGAKAALQSADEARRA